MCCESASRLANSLLQTTHLRSIVVETTLQRRMGPRQGSPLYSLESHVSRSGKDSRNLYENNSLTSAPKGGYIELWTALQDRDPIEISGLTNSKRKIDVQRPWLGIGARSHDP